MKKKSLNIIYYPQEESLLRQVSKDILTFNEETKLLAKTMLNTMQHHQGIGLAGVQVGVLARIFVMEIPEKEYLPKVFINPSLIEKSTEMMEYEEGCLSIADFRAKITRPKFIKIAALDEQGDPFEIELEGLPAICVQHEMDHLNGKLFIDYISLLKRNRLRLRLLKNS